MLIKEVPPSLQPMGIAREVPEAHEPAAAPPPQLPDQAPEPEPSARPPAPPAVPAIQEAPREQDISVPTPPWALGAEAAAAFYPSNLLPAQYTAFMPIPVEPPAEAPVPGQPMQETPSPGETLPGQEKKQVQPTIEPTLALGQLAAGRRATFIQHLPPLAHTLEAGGLPLTPLGDTVSPGEPEKVHARAALTSIARTLGHDPAGIARAQANLTPERLLPFLD